MSRQTNSISPYFIHRDSLFRVDGDTVSHRASMGCNAFLSSSGEVSWITGTPKDQRLSEYGFGASAEIHHIDSHGHLSLRRRFDLPKGYGVKTTALSKNALYLTGQMGDSILGFFDTRLTDPALVPMELPQQVKQKTFDDLLIDGERLLAVDNIVMPKWLVIYDISNPTSPKLIGITELMEGVNEHIVKSAVGSNYLALFCENLNLAGRFQSLQIYDKTNNFRPLSEVSLWQESYLDKSSECYSSNPYMSFAGDLLLIPGFGNGVSVLDCSKELAQDDVISDQLVFRDANRKAQLVLDATALPNSDKVIIWLSVGEKPSVVTMDKLICRPQNHNGQD